jgi:hypothetical protein
MRSFLSLRTGWTLVIYALIDITCVGMGMGVPIFCIILGLPVGWTIAKRLNTRALSTREILHKILSGAALTSAFTVIAMALVWTPSLGMLFDPTADLANYGIPQILYEPVASFIGWMALMIVISPFLQFLMMLFGAHLTWLRELSVKGKVESVVMEV